MGNIGKALVACLLAGLSLLGGAKVSLAADPTVRGLYWNFRYEDTFDNINQTIGTLKSLGVTRVHFWMNEPPIQKSLVKCDAVFGFADLQGHANWNAIQARQFVAALKGAGFKVVLTFSPYVATSEYVDSLFGPDAPVSIAREFADVDVELDIEGNWSPSYALANCPKLLSPQAVKALFVSQLREKAPTVALGISTDRWAQHADIIAKADWVSPQLYTPAAFEAQFKQVLGFGKPIWPALAPGEAGNADTFGTILAQVDRFRACKPDLANGYVIWSRHDIKPPSYAMAYLTGHPPTADRQPCGDP